MASIVSRMRKPVPQSNLCLQGALTVTPVPLLHELSPPSDVGAVKPQVDADGLGHRSDDMMPTATRRRALTTLSFTTFVSSREGNTRRVGLLRLSHGGSEEVMMMMMTMMCAVMRNR